MHVTHLEGRALFPEQYSLFSLCPRIDDRSHSNLVALTLPQAATPESLRSDQCRFCLTVAVLMLDIVTDGHRADHC
jgi:hypothetical protein